MVSDTTFCVKPDCPYYDTVCEWSARRIKAKRGMFSFANLSGQCHRYAVFQANKREEEKAEERKWARLKR